MLWTLTPYLLLERQVHWRRLLVAGALSAVGMTVFAIATPIYMPDLMTRATDDVVALVRVLVNAVLGPLLFWVVGPSPGCTWVCRRSW